MAHFSSQTTYTDQDLDGIIDLLVEAKDIMENTHLMNAIKKRSLKRAGEINSLKDLRLAVSDAFDQSLEDTKKGKKK